jgi:phosphoribosylamine--glycine ligase
MKILVIGSGGREHAIVDAIAQNSSVKQIFAAPGNGGTASLATKFPLQRRTSPHGDYRSQEKID